MLLRDKKLCKDTPLTQVCILGHLLPAKSLVDNLNLDNRHLQSELAPLVDWVMYHMVLSQFSIRHWYKVEEEPIKGIKSSAPADQGTCQSKKVRLSVLLLRYYHLTRDSSRRYRRAHMNFLAICIICLR